MGMSAGLLFIDRDPLLGAAVADALAVKMNFQVYFAGGFQLAEAFFHSAQLTVLVADVSITDISNARNFVARFVKRYPAAGLVLVSANPVLYAQFYPVRAVCLQKPYDTDQLAQAIMDAQDRVP